MTVSLKREPASRFPLHDIGLGIKVPFYRVRGVFRFKSCQHEIAVF